MFVTAGQRPFCTRSALEILLAGMVHFWEEGLSCLVEIFVEVGMRDQGAAQRAGCVCGSVLGDYTETRLAEHVTAGLTAVRAEVDIETHGAGEALSVLLLTVQQ